MMLDASAAAPSAGKCDGCGAADVPLTKISLGRDFFGRVYDRLSPSADLSPKWYCDRCSVEKNLQRDFRDIKGELDKLSKGTASALSQADQQLLRSARDEVEVLPDVVLKSRSLAVPLSENNRDH